MSEKSCATCLYNNGMGDCLAEQCSGGMGGWRPKDNPQVSITSNRVGGTSDEPIYSVSFVDKIKKALPKGDKFSLDKLINDHWQYNEDFASYLIPYDRAEWETSDLLALVEFAYKAAFRHGFKHALEHYGIEEKSDE